MASSADLPPAALQPTMIRNIDTLFTPGSQTDKTPPSSRLRVCVVGGGAAGVAAAWCLSRHPDRFTVQLWEAESVAGGVATSIALHVDEHGQARAFDPTHPDAQPHMPVAPLTEGGKPQGNSGPSTPTILPRHVDQATPAEWTWINDGVQGMAPTFHNTRRLFEQFGFAPTPIKMKFSFNKGDRHWNNSEESKLLQDIRSETRRFGFLLRLMHWFAPLATFVPITLALKLCCFSTRFVNLILVPLTALFMGTGNRTASVSASIVGQSFTNPLAALFEYDNERVVGNHPEMAAFPCLHSVYQSGAAQIQAAPQASVHFSRPVKRIFRFDSHVLVVDTAGRAEPFDHVILCCSPEVALRIVHEPTLMERMVLGSVQFYDDVSVTHQDAAYMHGRYDVNAQRQDQYFIYSYEEDPQHIEMSFNLSNYQSQLQYLKAHHSPPSDPASLIRRQPSVAARKPLDVWQSIYLDHSLSEKRWTVGEMNRSQVVAVKWWRQMAHRWQHFAFTVPLVNRLQGTRRTLYAGSWLLVNMHEVAVLSGLSAAYQLGADYPFPEDTKAQGSFMAFLLIAHASVLREWRGTVKIGSIVLIGAILAALFALIAK